MFGFTRLSLRISTRLVLTTAVGLTGATQSARGGVTAYDSFSDQAGQALAGMSGGTGFSDAWHTGSFGPDNSGSYIVQGSSLSGGTMPSLGGRVAALAQYSLGSGLTRDLSTPLGTPGTSAYFSMLVRPDGTLNEGASGGFFGITLNASTTTPALSQDLFIGKTGGGNFGLEDRGGNNSHLSSVAPTVGVSEYLVVKADFAASGPDTFTLYVNPTPGNMGTGVVKQDSFLGMINSISIYSTGAFSLDEIRVGTSLGDVMPAGDAVAVPEPASVVMLSIAGLGAITVGRLRRARRQAAQG